MSTATASSGGLSMASQFEIIAKAKNERGDNRGDGRRSSRRWRTSIRRINRSVRKA
jgi:hypothetical protein